MSWFEDLSPYTYHPSERGTLNVGWLDGGHDFPTDPPEPPVVAKLTHLCRRRQVNVTRGWHRCELCPPNVPRPEGHAEIRVRHPDGTVFAAPTLVAHYVLAHCYAPPAAFIEAVMEDDRVADVG
jgi:hypothetical protein